MVGGRGGAADNFLARKWRWSNAQGCITFIIIISLGVLIDT